MSFKSRVNETAGNLGFSKNTFLKVVVGTSLGAAIMLFQNCSAVQFSPTEKTVVEQPAAEQTDLSSRTPPAEPSDSGTNAPTGTSPLMPNGAPNGTIDNPAVIPKSESCVRNSSGPNQGPNYGQFIGQIQTSSRTFRVGEKIPVTWQRFPDVDGNWITIVPKAYEDNSWCAWFWNKSGFNGSHSDASSGSAFFVASEPGLYEIRGYYNWNVPNFEVIARTKILVVP